MSLAGVILIYFLPIIFYIYRWYVADVSGRKNRQPPVEAMADAIKSQQATIERLEKLVAKAALEKECK
jgi:hypothetical protein